MKMELNAGSDAELMREVLIEVKYLLVSVKFRAHVFQNLSCNSGMLADCLGRM